MVNCLIFQHDSRRPIVIHRYTARRPSGTTIHEGLSTVTQDIGSESNQSTIMITHRVGNAIKSGEIRSSHPITDRMIFRQDNPRTIVMKGMSTMDNGTVNGEMVPKWWRMIGTEANHATTETTKVV